MSPQTDTPDKKIWLWSSDNQYRIAICYKILSLNLMTKQIWKTQMPTKVQTFLWLEARNAILTWDNLQRSGWQGPNFCCLCQKARETIQHIFLDCGFIQEIWDTFKITEPIVAQHPKPTHIIKIWSNNITFRNKISSIMSRIAHIQENIS